MARATRSLLTSNWRFSLAQAGDHGPPVERTFDRPFAYALLHRATRTPVLIGACDDPAPG